MLRLAFGQSKKCLINQLVGLLHLIVYVAFVLINIELIEIILMGLRFSSEYLAPYFGNFYNFLIAFFELLAFLQSLFVLSFF